MAKRKEYAGSDITVTFDMKRCIHARNCFLKLPDVFDPNQKPWVQPDNAPAEEVASMIRSCPSGALGFAYRSGRQEQPPKINRIAVLENGPLAIAGDVSIDDAGHDVRVTLCRCGLSKNKPYCDYSHVEGSFQATGEPTPQSPEESDAQGGTIAVRRIPNGPLQAEGHVEIICGTGRKIAQHDKVFLCRCGLSKNKPYCDGSHKAAGFKDEL